MPPSKTAALEKRIEKLEQQLAAHKRQLSKSELGAAARQYRAGLTELRSAVNDFLVTVEGNGGWQNLAVATAAQRMIDRLFDPKYPIPRKPSK